jgi:uncharacterized membrane protein
VNNMKKSKYDIILNKLNVFKRDVLITMTPLMFLVVIVLMLSVTTTALERFLLGTLFYINLAFIILYYVRFARKHIKNF